MRVMSSELTAACLRAHAPLLGTVAGVVVRVVYCGVVLLLPSLSLLLSMRLLLSLVRRLLLVLAAVASLLAPLLIDFFCFSPPPPGW